MSRAVRLLRDVREATRLLLLLEVTRRRHTRLKGLAEKLDLTVAGVSEYVKAMQEEGLVVHAGGEYRATKKGVEFLQTGFLSLRDFVADAVGDMAIIDRTVSLAAEDVKEGERVGLFMEKGVLTARRRESPSWGVAAADAAKGGVLPVRNLEGIVALAPGKISLVRLQSDGRADRAFVATARRLKGRVCPDVVAAMDLSSKLLADRLGAPCILEFAAVAGSIEAAHRGLDVLLLCPEARVAEAVAAIEDANAGTEDKIPYETLSLR